jgi:predicted nucleotidyltransferase component of viral defense system
MLTYEALINEAKDRGMPAGKMRGILREYLQILILKELHRIGGGASLYFTGGTYLRFVYNLKRFSEDLDFNTDKLTINGFEGIVKGIQSGLKKEGILAKAVFRHWDNLYAANLSFPDIERDYGIRSAYAKKEGIVIKIETNRPAWKIEKDTHVVSGFGELFPCVCTERGALFADKIDALSKKEKARHIYDLMFMLAKHFPIDKKVLSVLGITALPLELIAGKITSFSQETLKKQAEALRPFLFEEDEADLIINARAIIPDLLRKYKTG